MEREELLKQIKKRLEAAHGERLKGVILYGSAARGDDEADSDIDIMVLLDEPISLWEDIETNVNCLYDLQLEVERPIHAHPVNAKNFQEGLSGLYRNAKEEGVVL